MDKLSHLLACQCCLETPKKAKLLRCFHVFCEDCLEDTKTNLLETFSCDRNQQQGEQIDSQYVFYKCNICKQNAKLDDVENVPIVDVIAETFETPQSGVNLCHSCEEQAGCRCLDCKVNFCSICQATHDAIPVCKQHQCIKIERENTDDFRFDQLKTCDEHGGQICTLNCVTCNGIICSECRALDHHEHDVETIKDGIVRLKPKVEDTLMLLSKRREEYLEEVAHLKRVQDEIDEKAELLMKVKHQEMEMSIAIIREDFKRIATEIDEKRQLNREAVQNEIEALQDESDVIKRTVDWSETMMETARDASLLEELQHGASRRLAEELEEKRKPMDLTDIQSPSSEFQQFRYNPNYLA